MSCLADHSGISAPPRPSSLTILQLPTFSASWQCTSCCYKRLTSAFASLQNTFTYPTTTRNMSDKTNSGIIDTVSPAISITCITYN